MISEQTSSFKLCILRIYHFIRFLFKKVLDLKSFLALLPSYFRKSKTFDGNIRKILIIDLQGIGDLLMISPLIESLEKKYSAKNTTIDLISVGDNGKLFANDTRIRNFRYSGILSDILRIRNKHYDLVICPYRAEHAGLITAFSGARYKIGYIHSIHLCHNNIKINTVGVMTTRDPKLKAENIRNALELPKIHNYDEYVITQTIVQNLSDKKKVDNILKEKIYSNKNKYSLPLAVLNCQNQWLSRSWPKDRWIELIRKLSKKYSVVLIGSPKDVDANKTIIDLTNTHNITNLSGELNITQTIEFLKRAKIFITTDCGPLHMGFAAHTPKIISLWGSTDMEDLCVDKYKKYAIWKNRDGRKCPLHNHNNEPLTNNPLCMSAITVNDVLKMVDK